MKGRWPWRRVTHTPGACPLAITPEGPGVDQSGADNPQCRSTPTPPAGKQGPAQSEANSSTWRLGSFQLLVTTLWSPCSATSPPRHSYKLCSRLRSTSWKSPRSLEWSRDPDGPPRPLGGTSARGPVDSVWLDQQAPPICRCRGGTQSQAQLGPWPWPTTLGQN